MHEAPSGLLSFAHHMRRASAVGDPRSRTSSLGDASDDGTEARVRARAAVVVRVCQRVETYAH